MAIQFRDGEEKKVEVNLHWSTYFWPAFFTAIFLTSGVAVFIASSELTGNSKDTVEVGILSKTKTDVPLVKVSDIEVRQSLFQRILGPGHVIVRVGNDAPTVTANIDKPNELKEALAKRWRKDKHERA